MSTRALLRGARVVPLDGRRQEKRGDVLVEDGRLSAIGGLREHVGVSLVVETKSPILPGFTQAFLCPEHHGLGRGFVPDPVPAALHRELARVSRALPDRLYAELVRASLEAGLLAGQTAFVLPTTVRRWRLVARAATALGVRAVLALDAAEPGLGAALEAIERGERAFGLSAALYVGAVERTPRRVLRQAAALSEAAGLPILGLLGADGASGGLRRLERAGALGKRTVLVFGAGDALRAEEDVSLMAASAAKLILVPSYSLYNGLALPPLDRLLARAVPLGLGGFSACLRMGGDAFRELRLLSRALRAHTPSPASTALEIAAAGGAAALGLETGELSVGRRADFLSLDVLVDEEADHETLCRILLERGGPRAVRSVWVEGRVVAADGRVSAQVPGTDPALFQAWWARREARMLSRARRWWRESLGGGPAGGLGVIGR